MPEDWMCTPDEDLAHGVMDEQADDDTTSQHPAEASGEGTAPRPPRPRLVMPNKPALKPQQLGETDLPVVLRISPSDAYCTARYTGHAEVAMGDSKPEPRHPVRPSVR